MSSTSAALTVMDNAATAHLPQDISFLTNAGYSITLLRHAAQRAAALGVSAQDILISEGHVAEGTYYRLLARALQLELIDARRYQLAPIRKHLALDAGSQLRLMALHHGDELIFAHAPVGRDVAKLLRAWHPDRMREHRLVLTTPSALREALLAQRGDGLVRDAIEEMPRLMPCSCAQATRRRSARLAVFLGLSWAIVWFLAARSSYAAGWACALACLFGSAAFVLGGAVRVLALLGQDGDNGPAPLSDLNLPSYTLLVPLYREARLVPQMLRAIAALDYPRAKLEIIFLLETDDPATRQAIEQETWFGPHIVAVLPKGGPRTKPRALQYGLSLARGAVLTIFDAEDVPAPRQLRVAAAALAAGGANLACVQARLVIDNAERSWLTRMFALEYAALFFAFLPGLARRGLPLPLGGTSNHFRVAALRAVGGWDAWNVTEDAELGLRLARHGYRVGVIDADTEEEAPVTLEGWLGQRTRWLKGWMQTSLAHLSQPLRLCADLGVWRALMFVAVLPVSILSALIYPASLILLGSQTASLMTGSPTILDAAFFEFGCCILAGGHVLAVLLLWRGARLARRAFQLSDILSLPAYWCLTSLAAWRAAADLALRPFAWTKTEHHGRITALATNTRQGVMGTLIRGSKTAIRSTVPPARRQIRDRKNAAT